MHTLFRFKNLEGRDHLEDLSVDEKITYENGYYGVRVRGCGLSSRLVTLLNFIYTPICLLIFFTCLFQAH
jgi:hypothetical protein